jgi:hypothetical protein
MISFKGTHFPKDVILYADFFYVRYGVSYRDLEDIMEERGVAGSRARTQDVWGAEGISGRVKFLPLAWAGMPKTSFRKNSDSPQPLFLPKTTALRLLGTTSPRVRSPWLAAKVICQIYNKYFLLSILKGEGINGSIYTEPLIVTVIRIPLLVWLLF